MGKGKLAKFADMETYDNVFQYPYSVVEHVPFAMQGHWHEQYFHNQNPIVLELGCGKGSERRSEERCLSAHPHRGHRPFFCKRRGAGNLAHIQRPADEKPPQATQFHILS